jgi:hypothetical protein
VPGTNQQENDVDAVEIGNLLNELAADGLQLRAEGDSLRFRADPGALTQERRVQIMTHKTDILRVVQQRSLQLERLPQIEDAEAVWIPSPIQMVVAAWKAPTLMSFARRWRHLDPEVVQAALDLLVARHDILRTRYMTEPSGRLLAVTELRRSVPVTKLDLASLPESERRRELHSALEAARRQPFDRERGPLLRLLLVRVSAHLTISLLVLCHSVFDWFSGIVFFREFATLCFRAGAARPVLFPPLPYTFREYARRENARIESDAGFEAFLHIRRRLLGSRLSFPLPSQPGFSAEDPSVPEVESTGFAGPALALIRETLRANRVTTFIGAATAVGLALSMWAKSCDAFVWIVDSGRPSAEMTGLIGPYASHAMFPMRFCEEHSLTQAVRAMWDDYREDRQNILPPPAVLPLTLRAHAQGVFLGVELNYLQTQSPDAERPRPLSHDGQPDAVDLIEDTSIFPLRIAFYERRGRLWWKIRFKKSVFTSASVDAFSQLIGATLQDIAQRPHLSIRDLRASHRAMPGAPDAR